jgi:hypothetical protein
MAANNSFIQALVNSGADAMKNMYDVYITLPGASEAQMLTVRAEGFKVPEMGTEPYEVKYHGTTYKKPKSEMTFDRQFELTFRMDAYYNLLGEFSQWHSMVVDAISGGVSNVAAALGKVKVCSLGSPFIASASNNDYGISKWRDSDTGTLKENSDSGKESVVWRFYDVWVSKVAQPEFSTDSAEAMKFTVTFQFGDCEFPYYNGKDKYISDANSTGGAASSVS